MSARSLCLLPAAALVLLCACAPKEPTVPPVSSAPIPVETPATDEGPGAYLERVFDNKGVSDFWAFFDPASGPYIISVDREAHLSRLRELMDDTAWERAEVLHEVPWDEHPPGGMFGLRLMNSADTACLALQWPGPHVRFMGENENVLWRCTGDYQEFYSAAAALWHAVDAQGAAEGLTAFLFRTGGTALLQAEGARYTLEDRSRVESLFEQMAWASGEPREDTPGGMTLSSMEDPPYGSITLYPDGPEVHYYLDEYNQFWYRAEGEESLYDLLLEEAVPAG